MSEVSVVVRAFNEERYLPALLASLRKQSIGKIEIIVVDSGSFDHTPEIAASFGCKLLRIEPYNFTFGHSLNVGIEAASSNYIAIASAHTLPNSTEWLQKLVAPLENSAVAMTYGRQLGNELSKFSERQDFLRTFGDYPVRLEPPHFFANKMNGRIVSIQNLKNI